MMPLKHCRKSFQLKKLLTVFGFVALVSGCASTVSISNLEESCMTQSPDFAVRAACIIQSYENLPEENRGTYEDLDRYFVDQLALLADEYKRGDITETQAEAALSRIRVEVESQRRERNYQYDRGRFGLGVGVGSYGPGYWGHYGY